MDGNRTVLWLWDFAITRSNARLNQAENISAFYGLRRKTRFIVANLNSGLLARAYKKYPNKSSLKII